MNLAGHAAGKVGNQIKSRFPDFLLRDGAPQRRKIIHQLKLFPELADPRCCKGFNRTGRNGVDPNTFRPQLCGQITDRGLQSGLGDPHDIVIGNRLLRAEVTHSDDAAPLFHQRRGIAADRQKRVGADVHGQGESVAGSLAERALEVITMGKRHGMHHKIELAPSFFELVKDRLNIRIFLNITWQHQR